MQLRSKFLRPASSVRASADYLEPVVLGQVLAGQGGVEITIPLLYFVASPAATASLACLGLILGHSYGAASLGFFPLGTVSIFA